MANYKAYKSIAISSIETSYKWSNSLIHYKRDAYNEVWKMTR